MIVVVLSVTPERLRGVLTRWLLEIAAGVYVGHVPARVRERLWLRIVDDVGRGRALMVWSTRNEQRLAFRVHNHAWSPVDYDGTTLMRRTTAESRRLATDTQHSVQSGQADRAPSTTTAAPDGPVQPSRTNWSLAGRRRRYRNTVEQRHQDGPRGSPTE